MTTPSINTDKDADHKPHVLNKAEHRVYNNLKKSLAQIKLHQEDKIELRAARELLKELYSSI